MKKIISLLSLAATSLCFGNIGTAGFHEYAYNKYFVETGTFGGYAMHKALDAGFTYVYSVDTDKNNIDFARSHLPNTPNIKLFLGDSGLLLGHMIKDIHEPITFWLDAHVYPPVEGKDNSPLLEELQHIKNHPVKTHTILIDDLHCCGTAAFDFITKEDLIEEILLINPNYTISYVPGGDNDEIPNNVLVAEVK